MIHDLDKTIETLLYEHGKLNKNEVDVSFDQPTGEWSASLSRPTISCWLYDLRENRELRNRDWEVMKSRDNNRAKMRLAPLRFDLTYLITAWTRKVEDEHRLLWRALGALSRFQSLDPEQTEGALKDQPYKMPVQVAQMTESSMTFSDIWSVLENQMRVGFNFCITVALDAERGFEAPLVLEAEVALGQSIDVPAKELSALDIKLKHPARKSK